MGSMGPTSNASQELACVKTTHCKAENYVTWPMSKVNTGSAYGSGACNETKYL